MVSFTCDRCQDTFVKKKAEAHLMSRCSNSVTCQDCSVSFTLETIKAHTSCVTEVQKYAGKYLNKLPTQPKSPITPASIPAPALLYASDSDSDIPVPTQAAPVKSKTWVPIVSPTSSLPNGTASYGGKATGKAAESSDDSSSEEEDTTASGKPRMGIDPSKIKRRAERQARNSDRNYRRYNTGAAAKRARTADDMAASRVAKIQRRAERDERRKALGLLK